MAIGPKQHAPWRGLGSKQQKVLRDVPLTEWVDYDWIREGVRLACRGRLHSTVGYKYIDQMINQLVERNLLSKKVIQVPAVGVGLQYKTVYFRGNNWLDAAEYYGWQ